jgi:hypothetical protein
VQSSVLTILLDFSSFSLFFEQACASRYSLISHRCDGSSIPDDVNEDKQ